MSQDWYLNTNWNDEIAAQFEVKIKRARRKGQYLRIQASSLTTSEPTIALELLNRYFAQKERTEDASAYAARAEALLTLGRVYEAIDSYEDALRTEAKFPKALTMTCIELPYLIGVRGISTHYKRALEILKKHRQRCTFQVDYFMWNVAQALIASAIGSRDKAKKYAKAALDFAASDHSGFRNHPSVGLVSEDHANVLARLR